MVRTAGDSRTLLDEIRREVPIVDPLMAATGVQSIEEYMALPLFPARTVGWLLGVSGILAVVMTAIGLFGVIAYMVSQRTHEIGVRMALGARRSDVMKMVMGQGLRLTGIGLGIGLAAALRWFAAALAAALRDWGERSGDDDGGGNGTGGDRPLGVLFAGAEGDERGSFSGITERVGGRRSRTGRTE